MSESETPTRDTAEKQHRRHLARSRWRLAAIAAAVVLLLGCGWFAAVAFQSPAQVAARTTAPPPGAVTATVSKGALARTVSLKATVQREQQLSATLLPGGEQREVVTKVPLPVGGEVAPLSLVLEVNGQPRFAIAGAFPFYRAMAEGAVGPDVKQLQDALVAAGYPITADGHLGTATADAVSRVFDAAGYAKPITSDANGNEPLANSPAKTDAPPKPSALSVPASAFIVFSTLPGVLAATPSLGSALADASTVTITTGAIVAAGTVDPATAVTLKTGMVAKVEGVDSTVDAAVSTVQAVPPTADASGSPSSDSGDISQEAWMVRLAFTNPPPLEWLQKEALTVITVSVTAADSLIVPSVAVVSAGDDDPHVLKQMPNGTFKSIRVKEIGVLAGRSAISPADMDELTVGDVVKVG
jgi:hypothetical protein